MPSVRVWFKGASDFLSKPRYLQGTGILQLRLFCASAPSHAQSLNAELATRDHRIGRCVPLRDRPRVLASNSGRPRSAGSGASVSAHYCQGDNAGVERGGSFRMSIFGMYCRAIKNSATTLSKLAWASCVQGQARMWVDVPHLTT
jgi:hypothetical protein